MSAVVRTGVIRSALSANQRFHCAMLRIVSTKPSQIEHVQFAAVNPPLRISANPARFHFEMTRPSTTVSESCRRVMQFPGEVCGTVAGDRAGEKCPGAYHSQYPKASAQLGGFETFALSGDQTHSPLATTVKLGRASAGLVLCTTLNAATGRRRPIRSRFLRSSNLATASTARATRLLTRICPSFASAHSLAARLHTVPIAV